MRRRTLAIGGSLRWHDPDRFDGFDLSRARAAPQAVAASLSVSLDPASPLDRPAIIGADEIGRNMMSTARS